MLSFKPFNEENITEVTSLLLGEKDGQEKNIATDIMHSALEDGGDLEFAASYSHGCLLLRVFDYGKYYFIYPYELCELADAVTATDEICEYAMKEELPLVFADVPADRLSSLIFGFRHLDLDAEDCDCSSYRVTVNTECQLITEIPNFTAGELTLDSLTEADVKKYAELSKNPQLNEFWGYDYKADHPDADDRFFYDYATEEFFRGVTLTLGIRWCKKLVGELLFYAFDGRGGASFALRIFPDLWGRGIGRRTVAGAINIAARLGLTRLYAEVMKQNVRSIELFSSVADETVEGEDRVKFSIYI